MSYKPPVYKRLFHDLRRNSAKKWLSLMPAIQIAITGSQGKTNTTRIIAYLLAQIGKTVVTDPNLDTIYNVPITALKITPWTKYAVFELGIDKPKEMDLHLQIVKPKIGVITGISPVHTDKEHLKSLKNLILEKRKLIEALPTDGYAILNYDDENVRAMAPYTKARILWYGTDPNKCDLCVNPKTINLSLHGTSFTVHKKQDNVNTSVRTRLIGKHHIYNIMAVFLVVTTASKLSGQNNTINRLMVFLEDIEPLTGRMNVETGPFGTTVLNDSLRANPSSTSAGLMTLSEIEYTKGRKIAILAEMGELEHPEEEHKKIGQLITKLKIDAVIGIGPLQKIVIQEIDRNRIENSLLLTTYWVKDVFDAAKILKKIIKKGDLLYLKGSLLRHVERVLMILEGKEVNCNVTICPFYNNCKDCKYLITGYQNVLEK